MKITNTKMKKTYLFIVFITIIKLMNSANYYWVNGTGNWSDLAGHWRTTSGGTTIPATVPGQNDDVFFDVNSFTSTGQEVKLNSTTQTCRNMNWTGANYNPKLNGGASTLNVYGSLLLISSMSITVPSFTIEFKGSGSITSAGLPMPQTIRINSTGTYTLQDDLTIYHLFNMLSGTFNTNNFNINCTFFDLNNTNVRTINFGTSKIYSTTFYLTGNNLTIANSQYQLVFENVVSNLTLYGTASNVIYIPTVLNTVKGNFTINSSFMKIGNIISKSKVNTYLSGGIGKTMIKKLEVDSSFNLVAGSYGLWADSVLFTNVNGNNYYTIGSNFHDTLRVFKYLSFASGKCNAPNYINTNPNPDNIEGVIVSPNNLNISHFSVLNNHIIGSGSYMVNNPSGSNSNLVGWNITPNGKRFYWVGNTGNWNDPTHWAFSSGGTPQLSNGCIPNMYDSVFFDASSFNLASQNVYLNVEGYCAYMNWTGSTGNPIFSAINTSLDLNLYGSLYLISNMNWKPEQVNFKGESNNYYIQSANQDFDKQVVFDMMNNGKYYFADDFYTKQGFTFYSGSIFTNNYNVRIGGNYFVQGSKNKFLGMGSSVFQLDAGYWSNQSSNYRQNYGTSLVKILGGSNTYINNAGSGNNSVSFYNIEFKNLPGYTGQLISFANDSINIVHFKVPGDLNISGTKCYIKKLIADTSINFGDNYKKLLIDSLLFNNFKGSCMYNYSQYIADTLFVNKYWAAGNGTCANPNTLKGNSNSVQSNIKYLGGTITFENYNLFNLKGILPGIYIGNNVGVSNNVSGFTINNNPAKKYYWVGNSGNWNDPTHWALSSGGIGQASSGCVPSRIDSVYFDANSFTISNQTVTMNVDGEFAYMDWTGTLFNPTFQSAPSKTINAYGSIFLNRAMKWNTLNTNFLATVSGNYFIKSNGQNFDGDVTFNSNGNYYLLDTFKVDIYAKNIQIEKGGFYSNNHPIFFYYLTNYSPSNLSRTIDLGTSKLYIKTLLGGSYYAIGNLYLNYSTNAIVKGKVDVYGGPVNTNANYSSINVQFPRHAHQFKINNLIHKGYISINSGINTSYNDTILNAQLNQVANTDYVTINGGGNLYIKNYNGNRGLRTSNINIIFDTLKLTGEGINTPIVKHEFPAGKTITVREYLEFGKNKCIRTILTSSTVGTNANLYVPVSKIFKTDLLDISYITQSGPGVFDAGTNSQIRTGTVNVLYTGPSLTSMLTNSYYCYVNDGSGCGNIYITPKPANNFYFWRTVPPLTVINSDTNESIKYVCGTRKYLLVSNFGTNCEEKDTIYVYTATIAGNVIDSFRNIVNDSNWFTCLNWNRNEIPDSLTTAIIKTGHSCAIRAGQHARCKNLIIEPGARFAIDGGTLSVYGKFENNGVFRHTNDTIYFKGGSGDTIGGANSSTFKNIVIDKWGSGNMLITSNDSVNGYLDLKHGIVYTKTCNNLNVLDNATSSSGSIISHVDGPMTKWGDDYYDFPIGDKGWWARLGITAPVSNSGYCAERFDEAYSNTTDTLHPLNNVSKLEYWTLNRISGISPVKVKLFWEDNGRSQIASNAKSDLRVAHWNGSKWEDAGNTDSSISFSPNGYITSNSWNSFSPFTFGSLSGLSPLPINWLDFNVLKIDDLIQTKIDFVVSNESDILEYEIEWSINGKDFKSITNLKSSSIDQVNSYSFTHLYPSNGLNFYRIKARNINNTFTYSKIKIVSFFDIKNSISIYPNPSNNHINILVNNNISENKIEITDLTGKIIFVKFCNNNTETNEIIDISKLNKGVYFIKVENIEQTQIIKLIKE